MKVLIGCECSGIVRQAFRKRGHDAWSCDMLPAEDDQEFHLLCTDEESIFDFIQMGDWDLAIFHPPCTYLNSAGLHWNKRRKGRQQKTEEALQFVRRLLDCKVPRIALENPVGCISTRIRKWDQKIQPFEFGEDASKQTCLWIQGLPLLTPTKFIKPRMVCECGTTYNYERAAKLGCPVCGGEPGLAKPRWANQTDSGQNKLGPSEDRWMERSRTYQGIADAMAEQWSNLGALNRGIIS